MLVCASLMPPVTITSPSGRIETPGQNMLCAVLLIVAAVTAPVVRSRIAVCVYGDVSVPKSRASSADHTTSLLPGISAAATGTNGNPIVGPHWPTTDGPVDAATASTEARTLPRRGPRRARTGEHDPRRRHRPRPRRRDRQHGQSHRPHPAGQSMRPSCRSRSPASGHTPQRPRTACHPATGSLGTGRSRRAVRAARM